MAEPAKGALTALVDQLKELNLQLRNIDKHLQNICEKLSEGLTVFNERMG